MICSIRSTCPLVVLALHSTIVSAQPSFQGLGWSESCAHAVSADGKVVVGYRSLGGSDAEAFRWTAAGGMEGLGDLPGGRFSSSAESVSGDGTVIVGSGSVAQNNQHAFRWTPSQGMVDIHVPAYGTNSYASSVSDNGALVVGAAGTNSLTGFRWGVITGPFSLTDVEPNANADGSVIAGSSDSKPVRWLVAPNGQMTRDFVSSASGLCSDISPDGNIAVGTIGGKAFRWRALDGLLNIHDTSGVWTGSLAFGVSADGSRVVGQGNIFNLNGDQAFIWDEANGMRRLEDVLQNDFGLDLSGWTLTIAFAVSDDGKTIVGCGQHQGVGSEAWIAHIPASAPAVPTVSMSGLLALLILFSLSAPVVLARCRRIAAHDQFDATDAKSRSGMAL